MLSSSFGLRGGESNPRDEPPPPESFSLRVLGFKDQGRGDRLASTAHRVKLEGGWGSKTGEVQERQRREDDEHLRLGCDRE